MTAVRICPGLPFSAWLVSKYQSIKQYLENTEENSLFNEAEHEPPSLTVFKSSVLKICEGGPTPPLFFEERIYNSQALAPDVAHSVTGHYDKMRLFRTALALALEPVGVSA